MNWAVLSFSIMHVQPCTLQIICFAHSYNKAAFLRTSGKRGMSVRIEVGRISFLLRMLCEAARLPHEMEIHIYKGLKDSRTPPLHSTVINVSFK